MRRARTVAIVLVLAVAAVPSAAQISGGANAVGAPAPAGGSAQRPGAPPPRDAVQGPRTGTARVRGRVTDADNGTPIRRAQIQLISPATGGPRTTTTDADGNYEIGGLPAAAGYSVSAAKNGYAGMRFGQRQPLEPATPFSLSDGQVRTRVDIALRRGGVIAVRVTDEFGDPMIGAQVQVQRYQYGPNGRQLAFAQTGTGAFITDDLGQTRVFGLLPGDYVVSAVMRNFNVAGGPGADDRSDGYPPTYFPGTPNPAEALAIAVEAGQEANAQFGLIAARLAKITGSVVDSQGRPLAGAQLMLTTATGNGGYSSSGGGQVAPDGTFTLLRVPPGDHVIQVMPRMQVIQAVSTGGSGGVSGFTVIGGIVGGGVGGGVGGLPVPPEGGEPEFAAMPVTVAGDDISGLTITTGTAGTISGRVVYEGTSPRPPAGQVRVVAQSSQPANFIGARFDPRTNGQVAADGTFQLRASRGAVLFRANAPNWALKSVTLRGGDITDTPTELSGFDDLDGVRIVLTDRTTELTGTVVDDRGQPADSASVVVLPADEREGLAAQRYVRAMRLAPGGQLNLRGLPPGQYLIAAFPSLEAGGEWDPRVRERVSDAGDRFSLAEGQKLTLSLRLVR